MSFSSEIIFFSALRAALMQMNMNLAAMRSRRSAQRQRTTPSVLSQGRLPPTSPLSAPLGFRPGSRLTPGRGGPPARPSHPRCSDAPSRVAVCRSMALAARPTAAKYIQHHGNGQIRRACLASASAPPPPATGEISDLGAHHRLLTCCRSANHDVLHRVHLGWLGIPKESSSRHWYKLSALRLQNLAYTMINLRHSPGLISRLLWTHQARLPSLARPFNNRIEVLDAKSMKLPH